MPKARRTSSGFSTGSWPAIESLLGDKHVLSQNAHLSARGRQQAGQHFDGGGLAGAVGAEKAEELPGGDAEVHILHGNEVSEAASQIFGCDRRRGVVWSIARFLH